MFTELANELREALQDLEHVKAKLAAAHDVIETIKPLVQPGKDAIAAIEKYEAL